MLVLSRTANQEVKIGDDVVVVVLKVRGNRVQLGFKAPKDVDITRGEIAGGSVAADRADAENASVESMPPPAA